MPRAGTVGLASLVFVLQAGTAHAQQFMSTGKDTLRGLSGVEVLVEELDAGLASSELTTAAIADGVKRQLAASGITVYTTQMQNPSPAKPYSWLAQSRRSSRLHGKALV